MRAAPFAVVLLAPIGRPEPILHEYVPPGGDSAGGGAAPEDAPSDGLDPGDGEPVLAPGAPAPFRPDMRTARDGLLAYHEPFDPAIAPLKRGTALDMVREDYSLVVGDPTLRPVAVGGHAQGGEIFHASLLVAFTPGLAVPIPSVAPDQRVLAIASEPPADLEVLRDGADNYFLRSPNASGRRRVTMQVEAPPSYFAPRVYPNVTPADVPVSRRPALPPPVREAAAVVIDRLDLRAGDALPRTLDRLVGVFRAFEAGPMDETTGDMYVDLALGGRGVCRHRAFAFVVTAQALGLPARFVENEAHAFAEVLLPRSGWARIDLGGDALRMALANASEKEPHRPGPDPFPQPLGFAEGYSRLRGAVDGAPMDAAAPRAARMDERPLPSGTRPEDAAGDAAAAPAEFRESLPSVDLALTGHETTGVRGDPIVVEGRADDAPGAPIELYLSPDGERRGLLLGATVAGGDGRFRLSATIPRDTAVGPYRMVVASPGDDRHGPGRSP